MKAAFQKDNVNASLILFLKYSKVMGVIGKIRKKLVTPLRVRFELYIVNNSTITQWTMKRKKYPTIAY